MTDSSLVTYLIIFGLPALGLLVLLPIWRHNLAPEDPSAPHKAQLAALDADKMRGAISDEEAASARLEIERRILKSCEQEDNSLPIQENSVTLRIFQVGLGATITVSAGLYLLIGSLDLGPSPGVTRSILDQKIDPESGITYKAAIETIRGEIDKKPEDQEALKLLASTLRAVGDASGAALTYQALAEIGPDKIGAYLDQFSAMMDMAGGTITPAASLILEKIYSLAPNHPAPDYFRGITAIQAGKRAAARQIWMDLVERSAPDVWYVQDIRQQLARLTGESPLALNSTGGEELAGDLRQVPSGLDDGDMDQKMPALTPEIIEDVGQLSDQEQQDFITSMVQRLEDRLVENPNDIKGWLRYLRAKDQLGEKEAATERMKQSFKDMDQVTQRSLQPYLDK